MSRKDREYLAASILSDGQIVTYRSLSRALKVHVNRAKEMLYEFHLHENGKKPGCVRATYLLSGVRPSLEAPESRHDHGKDGEDETMQSSPFMSSSMPQPEHMAQKMMVNSIVLVREEELETVRSTFEKITSIHVYSLQPHALKDLQVLSNANRDIYQKYASEDPLEAGRQYGTIVNPHVKRRSGRRPPPVAQGSVAQSAKPSPAAAGEKPSSNAGKKRTESSNEETSEANTEQETKSANQPKGLVQSKTEPGKPTKRPPAKRGGSGIFSLFAKAKPKLAREDTDSSAGASAQPSAPEDEPMKDASEDEQEEDFILPVSSKAAADREAEIKAKAEREEQLRNMMEIDDDEPAAAPPPATTTSREESPVERPRTAGSVEASLPPAPSTKRGRRRGRRRVMKKKTMKDEEGYLVTKEEPTWESFSEEEEQEKTTESAIRPSKTITATTTTAPPSSSSRGKKNSTGAGGNKAAQGDIKSFFSKR